MPQATLINPQNGEKVVVETGSTQAQSYFSQGFKLMGADGKPVGSGAPAPTPTPTTPNPVTAPGTLAPAGQAGTVARYATLFGPNGEREVVPVGSERASELQARGFTLTATEASGKKRATLVNRATGERRVVFTDTAEANNLLGQGFSLFDGQSPVATSDSIRRDQESILGSPEQDQKELADLERLRVRQNIEEIRKTLTGGLEAPTAPKMGETYQQLREQQGVAGIESKVTDLDKQIADLDASFRQGNEESRNKLAPMSSVYGQQRELQVQFQEKRDLLVREKAVAVDQLNTANSIISMQMQFAEADYQNALDSYNVQYKQAMDAYNIWQEQREFEFSKEQQLNEFELAKEKFNFDQAQQLKADASANLTTMYNMSMDAGRTWNDLDPAMRANVQKLELQAGLPAGTMQNFMNSVSAQKLLSTVEGYDEAGNGIVTFIYRDKNGNPGIAKTVKTGTKKKSVGDGDEPSLLDDLKADFEQGMSYEEAKQYYPEFAGPTIDKLYGKDTGFQDLFPSDTTTSTETPNTGTVISQAPKKKAWWQFWK